MHKSTTIDGRNFVSVNKSRNLKIFVVMEFYEVLERRRTIRDFSDKIVTDEVLEKILSAAFKAPTNDHLRQFEFIVVRGRENIARLVAPVTENTRTAVFPAEGLPAVQADGSKFAQLFRLGVGGGRKYPAGGDG